MACLSSTSYRFASWRSPRITCLHGVFPEPHRSIADASHHASHCLALSAQPETAQPDRSSWQDVAKLQLSFLRKRSKIVEILSADDLVFALTLAGVCEDRPTKSG